MARSLHVVGLGGTVRAGSSSEQALRIAMSGAGARGATTQVFTGAELERLPMYAPEAGGGGPVARELVEHLRQADGACSEPQVVEQLHTVAGEVVQFAELMASRGHRRASEA